MAKYKVLVSYGGLVSATAGETVNYTDKNIISDLLSAGYITEVKEAKAGKAPAEPSPKPKTAKAKKDNKEV